MKRLGLSVVLVGMLVSSHARAAAKVLTLGDHLKIWSADIGKDFKKIKTKDGLVTIPVYTDRMLDSLAVTGLQTNSTLFPTLPADLQTALTRLKTDVQDFRTKNSDFQKLIDAVIAELRKLANGATPPTVSSAEILFVAVYAGAADGEFSDKDKQNINDALADVVATPSIVATNLQDAVTALLAGRGATAADLALLKTDLASIATIIKGL